MAQNLWIPMMRLIEEVSRKAASQTFPPQASRLQNACAAYLQTWLILGLVEHQIKPNNCGPKWLIPATVYQTLCTEHHPNVAMRPADTFKMAKIRVCFLRAIGDQIESLQQSFESELSTFYTQSATCSKAPQSQDTYHMYNHQRSLSPRSVAFAQSPAPIPFPAF
eukprot:783910_1